MTARTFLLRRRDIELVRWAAQREEVSQGEFLRQAVRERANRILLAGSDDDDGPEPKRAA